jgi:hypothetical protein
MKSTRIKFLIISSSFVFFGFQSIAQFVTLEGRQFKDENGNNFYPMVCNYNVEFVTPTDPNDFLSTFISPSKDYGNSNAYECNGTATCNTNLLVDFNEILKLGFNTVRIMGLSPIYHPINYKWFCWDNNLHWTCPSAGFYIQISPLSLGNCDDYKFHLINVPDANSQKVFDHIRNVLDKASQAEYNGKKLKVILIIGGASGDYDPAFTNSYNNYLSFLIQYLTSHLTQTEQQTLLGYDLFNEPGYCWNARWPWNGTGIPTKEDVCNAFSLWYGTIKGIDPNHLITVGGWGDWDVFDFDPNILSLDFYSIHLYPETRPFEPQPPDNYSDMVNRIKGRYYWFNNNLSLPWIIGETGFSANRDADPTHAKNDGNEVEQQSYAEETSNDVWKCNGSGYSWWQYQDEGIITTWSGRFWGIITQGEVPNNIREKPVSQVFENFTTPTKSCDCEKQLPLPSGYYDYYDPYNHKQHNINQNWVQGHVGDANGNPIKDAYVIGWTRLYDKPNPITGNPEPVWDFHYSYTLSDGSFTIIPYDYSNDPPDYMTIEVMLVSAPACSRWHASASAPHIGILPSQVADIRLDKVYAEYDEIIDWDIYPGSPHIYQSSNKLTFQNATIYSGANCEGKARDEINLYQEFTALNGSEAWMHLIPISFPCDALINYPEKSSNLIENPLKDSKTIPGEIELMFLLKEDNFDVNIYPNPGEGFFNLEIITSNIDTKIDCFIYDQSGRVLMTLKPGNNSFLIDLSPYTKGVYFIRVQNSKSSTVKKIVII